MNGFKGAVESVAKTILGSTNGRRIHGWIAINIDSRHS
jgi:hypothetical protein